MGCDVVPTPGAGQQLVTALCAAGKERLSMIRVESITGKRVRNE